MKNDVGKNPTIRPRAISFSGSQQAQASCNLTCFHDAYRAVITVMGEPNSGIARGELRSTLSRAGSCRSSGQHQSTKKSSCRPIHSSYCPIHRMRPPRKGRPHLCFGSQETAMLCNQLLLGSLSSFPLLVPYVCIIHDRSTDEDGSVSTEADTEYQGYGKTTDRLAAEDCDSKHCHESRY